VMMTSPTFWPVLLPKLHPRFDQDFRAGHAVMSILGAAAFLEAPRRVRRTVDQHPIRKPSRLNPSTPFVPHSWGKNRELGDTPKPSAGRNPCTLLRQVAVAKRSLLANRSTTLVNSFDPPLFGDSRKAQGLRPSARPDRHSYPEQPWKFTFTPRANSPQARSPLDSSSSATSAKPSPSSPLLVCLPVAASQPLSW
jgi:hypothetical protein